MPAELARRPISNLIGFCPVQKYSGVIKPLLREGLQQHMSKSREVLQSHSRSAQALSPQLEHDVANRPQPAISRYGLQHRIKATYNNCRNFNFVSKPRIKIHINTHLTRIELSFFANRETQNARSLIT